MKQITVRKVNERAIERARELAKHRGVSLNRIYRDAIEKGLGVTETPQRYNDLGKFAGDSDFGPEWDKFLDRDLNRIDEDEWK